MTDDALTQAHDVLTEVRGQVGCITLNRPKALNALSLLMIRAISQILLTWRDDPAVKAVAVRGSNKHGVFGAFCAGGDIRFFHRAALAGNPQLEDFFTEEYALNHLIHNYSKPYNAFMDGVVMGGGMGISQGASVRLVTEHTKMAMPETLIGLFPDVGGGYFLSRCPGRTGEWLALTGETINAGDAGRLGLADRRMDIAQLGPAWDALGSLDLERDGALQAWLATYSTACGKGALKDATEIDRYFSLPTVPHIIAALELADSAWARHTAATLRKRSPLMLHVVLEQVRRARGMSLAEDLRMERDLVRHCFNTHHLERSGAASETVEGVRALAVDKDHSPMWTPARIEEVTPEMVLPFFASPWPAHAHPLAHLR
ncbi:MAG: enoyl-CoA hydratase/isomerase family protein [Rhodoferax sp.]|nr:enoyl-CoA hydratase/isomerase family protein [Rhodoferax sp.]